MRDYATGASAVMVITPFVRYGLIAVSTTLINQGIFNASDARAFATDPAIIQLVAGGLTAVGTLVWYWVSKSRAALLKET